MSPSRQSGKKAGKIHKSSKTQACQQCGEDGHAEDFHDHKPNFDEKDKAVKPERKAPGPTPKRRRPRTSSSRTKVEPSTPEAKVKEVKKPVKSSNKK